MGHAADPVRAAALGLIGSVLIEGRPITEADTALAPLEPAGRARALRLARLTLAHLGRADAMLAPHLAKLPPTAARNALRLAVVEMMEEGAAAHGVVDTAVTLLRADRRTAHLAGLGNAVLRRVAARTADDWAALGPQRLPGWLRGRLDAAYGRRAVAAIEAAHQAGAPLDLTAADGDAAALAGAVGGRALATGTVRLAGRAQVSALPGYAEGRFWVQDAAAALPARILAPGLGERVLDLCAAPGGKTLQLAAAGAAVTAVDCDAARMALVAANLERTGLAAETVLADLASWTPAEPAAAILLDAPCSATGTIRRHPELPFLREAGGLGALVAAQARLIDRAAGMLAPGGRLVFCTCSLLPEEGERQLAAALDRHPHLTPDPAALARAEVPADWHAPGGGLRLRPDYLAGEGGMDGFFIAALRAAA